MKIVSTHVLPTALISPAPANMKAPKAQPVAENHPPTHGTKPSGPYMPGNEHDGNDPGEMSLGDLLQKVLGR